LLERFGFADCSPVSTPIDDGCRLSKAMSPLTPEQLAEMHDIPYINAVGALMFLAVSTRPDIAHAVGVLCCFMANPGMAHWKAVKHLFQYIKGMLDHTLTYAPDPNLPHLFTTFTDADHGGNPDSGKLTSAYVVRMASGAVSWMSKLQSIIALSTTEAEFIAAITAGQELLWFRQFFTELGYDFTGPSPMFMDNQSAMQVAKNPEHHGRMKHLDLRYFWLWDEVNRQRRIEISYIPTADMAADLLTKPLGRIKVGIAREQLGVLPVPAYMRA
jgi:hypothetical protein